jgi:protein transport protein SEC31
VCFLQGRLGAALRYLEMVPGEASTSVAVLKDRIYRYITGCYS